MIDMNVVGGFPMQMAVASIPSAASLPNYTSVWLTDVGTGGGSEWYAFNGEWYPRGGKVTLARSAVAVSVTGTTAKTTTATVSVPALLGLNGRLRIHAAMTTTNNANGKGMTIEFGGQQVCGSALASILNTSGSFDVSNRNSASSQISTSRGGNFGVSGTNASLAFTATTVDTSAAASLVFSFTLANSADTATLEGYTVEIIK